MARCGAIPTLVAGGIVAVVSVAAIGPSVGVVWLCASANFGRGFGFGLLTPSGQTIAQAIARQDDRTRLVGLFTVLFVVRNLFGPAVAEWTLRHWGVAGFFGIAILPMATAVVLAATLPRRLAAPDPPRSAGYLRLLPRLWLPALAAMQSGAAYGFASTLLAATMVARGEATVMFFAPFAVTLAYVRFVAMGSLQRLPPSALAGLGVVGSLLGLVLLCQPVLAGALVGLG